MRDYPEEYDQSHFCQNCWKQGRETLLDFEGVECDDCKAARLASEAEWSAIRKEFKRNSQRSVRKFNRRIAATA